MATAPHRSTVTLVSDPLEHGKTQFNLGLSTLRVPLTTAALNTLQQGVRTGQIKIGHTSFEIDIAQCADPEANKPTDICVNVYLS